MVEATQMTVQLVVSSSPGGTLRKGGQSYLPRLEWARSYLEQRQGWSNSRRAFVGLTFKLK